MALEDVLENIKAGLEKDGYVSTLESPELRKWEYVSDLKTITILMNHPMTEMRITLIDPEIICILTGPGIVINLFKIGGIRCIS